MSYPIRNLIKGRQVACIEDTEIIRDALVKMVSNNFSQLPVVNAEGRMLGVISEQTIVRRYYMSEGASLFDLSVSHCMARVSTLTPEAIRRAVFNEQPEIFSRVPGVGAKTAQKISFSLQDKISKEAGYEPLAAMSDADSEVLSALVTLGYSVVEAQAALQSIPKDAPEDVESRLRLALVYFS